MTVSEVLPMR